MIAPLGPHRFTPQCQRLANWASLFFFFCLPISIASKNIALGLTLILIILSANWLPKIKAILKSPIALSALGLFIFLGIGVLYSDAPQHDAIAVWIKYDRLLFLVFLVPLLTQLTSRNAHYHAFLFGCLLVFFFGAANMLGLFDIATLIGQQPQTAAFPLIMHIYASLLLCFGAFIALTLAISPPNKAWRWFYCLAFVGLSYDIIFMSQARTGYLGYFLLAIVAILQHCRWKQVIIAIISLGIIGFGAYHFSPRLHQGIDHLGSAMSQYHHGNTDTSSGNRLVFLKKSYQLWQQHPIIGHGTGSFKADYLKLGGPNPLGHPATAKHPLNTPHNEYALLMVQTGLIGLALFLLLLVTQWRNSSKLKPLDKQLAQGFIILFAASCFSDAMLFLSITGTFFIAFSALFAKKSP